MKLRRLTLTLALALAGLASLGAGPATADPVLNLDIHHNSTHFAPGGQAEYWFTVDNVGDAATSGPLTLEIDLPSGVRRNSVKNNFSAILNPWSCPGSPGDTTVACTLADPIPRHDSRTGNGLILVVDVAPTAGGDRLATATLAGGGAPDAPPAAGCSPGLAACDVELTRISADQAGFGIVAGSFFSDFYRADAQTPVRASGAHPPLLVTGFDFNSVFAPTDENPTQTVAAENVRNLRVDLPPGFVGAPAAVGECSQAEFSLRVCPATSQVGRIDFSTYPVIQVGDDSFRPFTTGVFNLSHPFGTLTDLAFQIANNPIHIEAVLDPQRDYAVSTTVSDINETLPVFHQKLTVWGVPADPAHDSERCPGLSTDFDASDTSEECPSDGPLRPFLTVPFQCGADNVMRFRDYDSWEDTGDHGPDIAYEMPGPITDCGDVPFQPTVSIDPTTDAADSPAGLDVRIELPQQDDCDPGPPVDCGIATSPLRDATVTLPEGLVVNAASANGLDACTPAEISLGTDDPVRCPDAAKIASVELTTPALPDPVEGVVFLATPFDNPFDSLLAGYIVLHDPARGLLVKIPGRIEVDAASGQITGTFEDNPQLPFSRFELHFKGGAHSSLITPKTCGEFTAEAEFAPWSGNPAVQVSDSFTISQGTGGGACAATEGALPNAPSFDAGTVSPISKAFSPFVMHLRRSDGSQNFSALSVNPPQGLVAKLAGTAICSEAELAGAAQKSGAGEKAAPSCPAASRVGTVVAGAGAGPAPYYAPGTLYMAGPYKGAPLSFAAITPATAGPFDLGTIVVRAPLYIDPKTAQVSTVTDPIPSILQGIPLDVRTLDIALDRPEFTLTGTSCDPSAVNGLLTSTLGQIAPLTSRFQLSDCTRLGFKPKMSLRLRGGTKRGKHPALTLVLAPRPGDANIASFSVAFPKSEFLENAHIRTICTRPDFAADACPAGAVYGRASVTTPLLDYPLSGNVYLRSSDNLLPDIVPDLRGPSYQPIRLETAGRTDSIGGGIRNTLDFVPDAPFTKAVVKLQGGSKGLLVNSRDICAKTYRATVKYTAHNGATYVDHPKLRAKCGRGRRGKRRG